MCFAKQLHKHRAAPPAACKKYQWPARILHTAGLTSKKRKPRWANHAGRYCVWASGAYARTPLTTAKVCGYGFTTSARTWQAKPISPVDAKVSRSSWMGNPPQIQRLSLRLGSGEHALYCVKAQPAGTSSCPSMLRRQQQCRPFLRCHRPAIDTLRSFIYQQINGA